MGQLQPVASDEEPIVILHLSYQLNRQRMNDWLVAHPYGAADFLLCSSGEHLFRKSISLNHKCCNETLLHLIFCLIQDWNQFIWDLRQWNDRISILQPHRHLSSSACECLVTALACSITTWFQRHSPFLLTRLKCSSSLVSDFYWIARLLLPITQSCATVRRHCCFLLCVVTNQTNNQKFSSYAVKTQTLKIPLLLRFCWMHLVVGGVVNTESRFFFFTTVASWIRKSFEHRWLWGCFPGQENTERPLFDCCLFSCVEWSVTPVQSL